MKTTAAWIHDIAWVAWNDVTDSLRSRRTIMLIVLFAGMVMLFGWHIIRLIEDMIASVLGIDADDPAAMAAVWQSREYARLARRVLGRRLQTGLPADLPPVVWIYGIAVFTLTPVLVAWTSAARIAEDIGNRGVRFVGVRTGRGAWCLGKFCGQALQLLLATLAAGLGMWLLAWHYMTGFRAAESAVAMLQFSLVAWIWGLGYLGIALGISQMNSRHHLATMFAMLALIGIARVHRLAERSVHAGAGAIWEHLNRLFPTGYYYDLWTWDTARLLPAAVMTLALALIYLFIGYGFFARRDL